MLENKKENHKHHNKSNRMIVKLKMVWGLAPDLHEININISDLRDLLSFVIIFSIVETMVSTILHCPL